MAKIFSDEEIKSLINQILEGTDFKLISFERNHEMFGNMIVNIQSEKEKYTFSTDRGDIWCNDNDRHSIHAGYHNAGQDDTPTYLIKAIKNTVLPNPNIRITWEEPVAGSLRIRLGYEEWLLDTASSQAEFTVDKPGKYSLEVIEEPLNWHVRIPNVGISLIYRIIYGVICALNAMGSPGKWEKDVRAYVVKGRFEVELIDSLELVIDHKPSEYLEEQKDWGYPSLDVTPALKAEIQFDQNALDISSKLNDYIVGLRTIAAPGIIFFCFIALKAMFSGAGAVAITFGVLTVGIIAAVIGTTRSQRKKCRRLYEIFMAKNIDTSENAIEQ